MFLCVVSRATFPSYMLLTNNYVMYFIPNMPHAHMTSISTYIQHKLHNFITLLRFIICHFLLNGHGIYNRSKFSHKFSTYTACKIFYLSYGTRLLTV